MSFSIRSPFLRVSLAAMAIAVCVVGRAQITTSLVWDATLKKYDAKAGETQAIFFFSVTNVSKEAVTFGKISTSCGCVSVALPKTPWTMAPGETGKVQVTVDLHAKWGTLRKAAFFDTSAGPSVLNLELNIPKPERMVMAEQARERNQEQAKADRQAVFRGDCARCHLEPAKGKRGEELYDVACAICHDTAHRATMVPDLRALKHPTDKAFWRQWVTEGKAGTLMPAFAQKEGGPLSAEQVDSLVEYLDGRKVGK